MQKISKTLLCSFLFSTLLFSGFGLSSSYAQSNLGAIPGQYIIVLKDDSDPEKFTKSHKLNKIQKFDNVLNGLAVSASAQKILSLKNDDRVLFVEPDLYVQAHVQTLPTGINRIETDKNSIAKIDGIDERVDIDVAILDTGIDLNHPDLNVVHFATLFLGSSFDPNGHGSHVAGSVAALDNGLGVVGVAPGAKLWAIQVLDANGNGSISGIIAGLDYVAANADQIEVANLSLGGVGKSDAFRSAFQNLVNAGVVVVVSAGNASDDVYGSDGVFNTSDDHIPAAYPEVMTISALADSDGASGGIGSNTVFGPDDSFATFSNFANNVVPSNPVISTGKAIDLILPGVNILSTYKNGGYAVSSGTSMSSPHGAGLAALYIDSIGTRDVNGDGLINAADVYSIRQSLVNNGVAQNDPRGLSVLNDPDSNLENLGWAEDTIPPEIHDIAITSIDAPASAEQGELVNVNVNVSNQGTFPETFDVLLSDETDNVLIGTQSVALNSGQSDTVSFVWNTVSSSLAEHTLSGQATIVTGETDTADNVQTYNVTITALDNVPPLISNVQTIEITDTSAKITWDTDEPSDSLVRFGISVPPTTEESDTSNVVSHSVFLTGLNSDTTYFYEVESSDLSSNTAIDDNLVLYYQFTTTAASSTEMHVENIEMSAKVKGKSNKSQIFTTVTIQTSDGTSVSGAQVTLNLSGTEGSDVTLNSITDLNGNAQFTYSKAISGNTYTSTVTDVSKSGFTYNSLSNVETFDFITI